MWSHSPERTGEGKLSFALESSAAAVCVAVGVFLVRVVVCLCARACVRDYCFWRLNWLIPRDCFVPYYSVVSKILRDLPPFPHTHSSKCNAGRLKKLIGASGKGRHSGS